MRILLCLVGLQGSGKTTLLNSIESTETYVLKPSTERPRRSEQEDEYYFETEWDSNNFEWDIIIGNIRYGMRKEELEKVREIGITVFSPERIEVLESVKSRRPDFEIITIGLDTIHSVEEQHRRVGKNNSRCIKTSDDFENQVKVIRTCDIILSGKDKAIQKAVRSVIDITRGRGGFLHKEAIKNLIEAGALLENADINKVESASYDLRLADKYWCQGKYKILDDTNPTAEIPPYSFILVQAKEYACLPNFLSANFDTTVTLFLQGVILSNGPQVDPGYKGALFCMLYNTSDRSVGITRGRHFATIQFTTTTHSSGGYTAQYQGKKTFEDFLDGRAALSPGGKILERIEEAKKELNDELDKLRKELKDDFKNWMQRAFALFAFAATILIALTGFAMKTADKAEEAQKQAELSAGKANSEANKAIDMVKTSDSLASKADRAAAQAELSASKADMIAKLVEGTLKSHGENRKK